MVSGSAKNNITPVEIEIDFLMSIFSSKLNTGTITKPPPKPESAVTIPAPNPISENFKGGIVSNATLFTTLLRFKKTRKLTVTKSVIKKKENSCLLYQLPEVMNQVTTVEEITPAKAVNKTGRI